MPRGSLIRAGLPLSDAAAMPNFFFKSSMDSATIARRSPPSPLFRHRNAERSLRRGACFANAFSSFSAAAPISPALAPARTKSSVGQVSSGNVDFVDGCSSRMVWKFVPPKPNEFTPARRGLLPQNQGRGSVLT